MGSLTQGVQVLVAGQVVADHVVRLPASKEGETGPHLHLHRVLQHLQVGGGDVSDLVAVVHVLGRGGEDRLLGKREKEIVMVGIGDFTRLKLHPARFYQKISP